VESNKDNRAIEIVAESIHGEYHVHAVLKGVSSRELASADIRVNIVDEGGL
jgi:hypothetical protein